MIKKFILAILLIYFTFSSFTLLAKKYDDTVFQTSDVLLSPLGDYLDCTGPTSVNIQCNSEYSGDTSTGVNNGSIYICWNYELSGPEVVHYFSLDNTSDVSIYLTQGDYRLDLILLSDCNTDNCVPNGGGDSSIIAEGLPPGQYYLVVDGRENYSGPYTITIYCSPASPTPVPPIPTTNYFGGTILLILFSILIGFLSFKLSKQN